jgi:hypothetical protein
MLHDLIYMQKSKNAQLIQVEDRVVITRGWSWVGREREDSDRVQSFISIRTVLVVHYTAW